MRLLKLTVLETPWKYFTIGKPYLISKKRRGRRLWFALMYSDWVGTVLQWTAFIYCFRNCIEIFYIFSDLLLII